MNNKKNLLTFFTSLLFWAIMYSLVPLYTVIILLLLPLKVKIRHKIASSWALVFTFLAKYLCGIKYVVKGKEHLINTPSIIASNHQSTWETMSFVAIFPSHVWVLKRELLRIPFFGLTLSCLAPIAIDRSQGGKAIKQVLTQGAKRITQGFWILMFPEGTRVPVGVEATYKNGAAKLALGLNIAIIPVGHNAGHCMPRKSFWLYPGVVEVKIGKAIYPNPSESPEDLTTRVKAAIKNLCLTIN
jgi:1-acyl-sn-glycerol-3-phosphate acyltransferase